MVSARGGWTADAWCDGLGPRDFDPTPCGSYGRRAQNGPSGPAASAKQSQARHLSRWYEAWTPHDVHSISSLMTDAVRYENPGASPVLHAGGGGRVRVSGRRVGGEELVAVAVGILNVDATPAAEVIDLAVFAFRATVGAEDDLRAPEPLEHAVEGRVVDEEAVVAQDEVVAVVEIEGEVVVDVDTDERRCRRPDVEAEKVGKEASRALLVAGADDGVVEHDALWVASD